MPRRPDELAAWRLRSVDESALSRPVLQHFQGVNCRLGQFGQHYLLFCQDFELANFICLESVSFVHLADLLSDHFQSFQLSLLLEGRDPIRLFARKVLNIILSNVLPLDHLGAKRADRWAAVPWDVLQDARN